jgi:hypothetical protein
MGDIAPNPLEPLWRALRDGEGPCPFVIEDATAKHVTPLHHFGGRDATYVSIGHDPPPDEDGSLGTRVKVTYAPFVEGTTIIYDVIERTLQGKARPFFCKVARGRPRLYALLPYQIETIQLAAERVKNKLRFDIAFADARGEAIQAVLPFEIRFLDKQGETRLKEIRVTNREGRHVDSYDYRWGIAPGRWSAVVLSLLTGREQSIEFEPPS